MKKKSQPIAEMNVGNVLMHGKKIKLIKIKRSQINYSNERSGSALKEQEMKILLNLRGVENKLTNVDDIPTKIYQNKENHKIVA